ncbi:carbonic anhydrase [Roseibium sp. Sym1]|uniref:carbonic anhydrase n=1 Tax=Roseibium sp. Sym1 TaxID=3016006 RepID=UPI0022B39D7E|nr:carbonic anhydrase [Roseibium sp. Sym1]
MTDTSVLFERNRTFSNGFDQADLPILPRLNTLIVACIDARVDPAHVLGLELGDAVVVRNNGGRATRAVIEEIATLAMMVSKMTQNPHPAFNVVLMQHTQCGAQNFANPEFQQALREKLGIDVSSSAITDQETDLKGDVNRLRDAEEIPGSLTVSAVLYDVRTGGIREIAGPARLSDLRLDA